MCLYNWLIPNYHITEAVFFHHDVSCTQLLTLYETNNNNKQLGSWNEGKFKCQLVHYEIPNKNYKNFFKTGHKYQFELQMKMPDSLVNRNLGMFMIRLLLFNSDNNQIYDIYRPAILPYHSPLLTLAKLIFYIPLYLIGYLSETNNIQVMLLDQHADVDHLDFGQINKIRLEIDTLKQIEIIPPSALYITVDLKGFQYLMYFWPITSAIIIISSIFSTLLLVYICSIFTRSYNNRAKLLPNDDPTLEQSQQYFNDNNGEQMLISS